MAKGVKNLILEVKLNGVEKKSFKYVCDLLGLDYHKTYHEWKTSLNPEWEKVIDGNTISVKVLKNNK